MLLPLPLLLTLMAAGLYCSGSAAGKKRQNPYLIELADAVTAESATGGRSAAGPAGKPVCHVEWQRAGGLYRGAGRGYTYNRQWAPSSNLLNNSLPRVTEGVRQWRRYPQAKMIFTGAAAGYNPRSNASVAADVARSLGVPDDAIIVLDQPHDTGEEALAVKQTIGQHPFLLVTSANHLPRAMHFFQSAGLNPLPAPANQLAITSPISVWDRTLPRRYGSAIASARCTKRWG